MTQTPTEMLAIHSKKGKNRNWDKARPNHGKGREGHPPTAIQGYCGAQRERCGTDAVAVIGGARIGRPLYLLVILFTGFAFFRDRRRRRAAREARLTGATANFVSVARTRKLRRPRSFDTWRNLLIRRVRPTPTSVYATNFPIVVPNGPETWSNVGPAWRGYRTERMGNG